MGNSVIEKLQYVRRKSASGKIDVLVPPDSGILFEKINEIIDAVNEINAKEDAGL